VNLTCSSRRGGSGRWLVGSYHGTVRSSLRRRARKKPYEHRPKRRVSFHESHPLIPRARRMVANTLSSMIRQAPELCANAENWEMCFDTVLVIDNVKDDQTGSRKALLEREKKDAEGGPKYPICSNSREKENHEEIEGRLQVFVSVPPTRPRF